jgi:DNA-binding LacI/PurR family transcriptional regulator
MELIHARTLMEHRVDGIIVSPTANEIGKISRATKELTENRVRTVILGRAA